MCMRRIVRRNLYKHVDVTQVRDLLEWGVGAMAANPDEAIPEAEETSRLAVLDLDWERIRATDILVVLCSFLGKVRLPTTQIRQHEINANSG